MHAFGLQPVATKHEDELPACMDILYIYIYIYIHIFFPRRIPWSGDFWSSYNLYVWVAKLFGWTNRIAAEYGLN